MFKQNGVLAISSKINIKSTGVLFKSIKSQLFVILVLVGFLPMCILVIALLSIYESQATSQKVNELRYHGNIISNLIAASNYMNGAEGQVNPEINSEIAQVAEVYKGRIIIVDRNLGILKDTYGLEEGKTLISEEVVAGINGNNSSYIDKKNEYAEIVLPITKSDTKETMGVIIMSFSISNIFELKQGLNQTAVMICISIVILILLFAFLYSGFLSKPLRMIVESIHHLTEGFMDEKITIAGSRFQEMENIAEAFNQMIDKMQTLESSRQEFVSNVSHELKTPITSIKVLSDSLLSQEEVPAELYREFLVDITEEIERENKIINDLLSLVKMDKKASEMNIASVNINELLEIILKRLRPIAAERNIELVFESFRPVLAEVDEVKLSLAMNNLIENAIKYNYDDGWVRVSLNADHKFFYVKVADSGVGVPEEEQDKIFERFYRVDKARSRETGGTGLGLSITRNAILMHRGAIKVYSKEKEGTTFTVRIPLNYIA